jgi:hypothetical protein
MLLLAQIVASEWFAPLTQFGIGGGMLIWFATRVEARMKSMEVSVDRMARASVLQVLAFKLNSAAGADILEQAKAILAEIEEKQRNK